MSVFALYMLCSLFTVESQSKILSLLDSVWLLAVVKVLPDVSFTCNLTSYSFPFSHSPRQNIPISLSLSSQFFLRHFHFLFLFMYLLLQCDSPFLLYCLTTDAFGCSNIVFTRYWCYLRASVSFCAHFCFGTNQLKAVEQFLCRSWPGGSSSTYVKKATCCLFSTLLTTFVKRLWLLGSCRLCYFLTAGITSVFQLFLWLSIISRMKYIDAFH